MMEFHPVNAATPTVSIIIPTYNRENYIREAIASVLEQETEYRYEIIVSDDCSTDRSAKIAESFGDAVRVLIANTNRGVSANRNAAIRAARGTYIAMLDDDDRMLPGRLQSQVTFLERHPDIGVAIGLCKFEAGERALEDFFLEHGLDIPWGEWRVYDNWRTLTLRHFFGYPSACTFRKDLFDRIGLYDESLTYAEDFELLARASTVSSLACLNSPVTWRRTSSGDHLSKSSIARLQSLAAYAKLIQSLEDLSPEERCILRGRYRYAVLEALSMSLQAFGRRNARQVLWKHGRALTGMSRVKWAVACALPWALVQRLARIRSSA